MLASWELPSNQSNGCFGEELELQASFIHRGLTQHSIHAVFGVESVAFGAQYSLIPCRCKNSAGVARVCAGDRLGVRGKHNSGQHDTVRCGCMAHS